MSPTAPPPQLPPQVSPDGKWVWDGRQWQPVAVSTWVPAAAAVIPQAAAPTPSPVAAVKAPVYVAPEQVLMPSPTYNFPVAEPIAPPWQKPAREVKTYIYVAGGVVVLIMVMLVLNSLSVVPWHFFGSDPVPTAQPTPTPLVPPATTRSDFVRADRFLKYTVNPEVVALNSTLPDLRVCNGTLSNSCFTALTASEQQMKKLQSVVDHATVPPCIATGTGKVRADLAAMEAGLQLALKAYPDNSAPEVSQGLNRFSSGLAALVTDGTALDQVDKMKCSTDQVGP